MSQQSISRAASPQVATEFAPVKTAAQYVSQRFHMPSGRLLEVRRVQKAGPHPEVAVREVVDDGELAPFEFDLRLCFLLNHCKEVPRLF